MPASTVVVFEDTFDDRYSLTTAIRTAGHRVHTYSGCLGSGAPATISHALHERQADVAVWDLSPTVSRYCADLEALLRLRAFGRCYVIVVTSSARTVSEYLGSLAGAVTILQKPIPEGLLELAVAHRRVDA